MLSLHVALGAILGLVSLAQARTSISLCYTEPAFTSCYDSIYSTQCNTLDAAAVTPCACSTATAYYSCYTSVCTSDKYYSSYMAAISSCDAMGFGGGAPPPAATATGGSNAGATTGTGAGAAGPTATGKNAGSVAGPPGWGGRGSDAVVFAVVALGWVFGVGAVML